MLTLIFWMPLSTLSAPTPASPPAWCRATSDSVAIPVCWLNLAILSISSNAPENAPNAFLAARTAPPMARSGPIIPLSPPENDFDFRLALSSPFEKPVVTAPIETANLPIDLAI